MTSGPRPSVRCARDLGILPRQDFLLRVVEVWEYKYHTPREESSPPTVFCACAVRNAVSSLVVGRGPARRSLVRLDDLQERVHGRGPDNLARTTRPTYFDMLDHTIRTQSKVQYLVVLPAHVHAGLLLAKLAPLRRLHQYHRADTVAVRTRTGKRYLNPIIAVTAVPE